MIYLDNNATTRLHPRVIEAMHSSLKDDFANPSSAYTPSKVSKKSIEEARRRVAAFLGAHSDEEIVFTSGGTESDNWAILGVLEKDKGQRGVVTSTVEHEAIRNVCDLVEMNGVPVSRCQVDENGALDVDELIGLVDENTAIVSVMLANNETGVVFPVEEIASRIKEKSNALFHVDGVNAAGKIPIKLSETDIDLFSISAHKFHGPKGVGALYVKDGVEIPSRNIGGGQEFGKRAGTEAVHQIVGLGVAAEIASDLSPMEEIGRIRDEFESRVKSEIDDVYINGEKSKRIPNTSNISFAGRNGEIILAELDSRGVCVSTGSACNEANHVSSPVLRAMGVHYSHAMGTIRFSFGRQNSFEELDPVVESVKKSVETASVIAGRRNI